MSGWFIANSRELPWYGAGVTRETTDPREAYADFAPDREISAPPAFPPF